MNEIQNKKNITNGWKYALVAVIFVFIIGGSILAYLWNKEKNAVIVPLNTLTPVSSVSPSPTSTPTPTITPPQEVWQTYINSELGFLIKYPQMVYGLDRCSSKNQFYVPLKIFENNKNGATYITEEYYYDYKLQTDTGLCEKISYSLESLLSEENNAIFEDGTHYLGRKPFLGWNILMKTVKNNNEINKFVKDNYGSGCLMESKNLWSQQAGVYDIKLNAFKDAKGNDTDLGSTVCPVNYVYRILYAPGKNKIMSVKLGQECSFYTDPNSSNYKCYDEKMIDSFEFK